MTCMCVFVCCVQDGRTPSELAAAKGHAEVVQYLKDQSAIDEKVSQRHTV